MASKETITSRLELGPDWLTGEDAARALGITLKSMTETVGPLLTRRSRSLRGRGARGVGYAYAREDVERTHVIMLALGYDALTAARTLRGIRVLGEKKMLRNLETQLPIDLHGHVKRKRARQ